MTAFSRALSCLMLALLVSAAGEPPGSDVVAQRGDIRMTEADLKDALALMDPAVRAQVTATPQSMANFVRERLLNLSLLAEARSKGWDTRPEIQRRMNEARDAAVLQTYLASLVPPDPSYPSEAEVTSAYEANKSHLVLPRQYHIAQIVATVRPGATKEEDEAAHKKANDFRTQAMRPKADFAELARKHSQDMQSADKGGDVGWLREPDMIPQVRETVSGLVDGGISQPVRVPDGWHVLKLLETRASAPLPLSDARPQIIQALRQARAQRMMRAYLDEMVKTQPVVVNEIELTKQVGQPK